MNLRSRQPHFSPASGLRQLAVAVAIGLFVIAACSSNSEPVETGATADAGATQSSIAGTWIPNAVIINSEQVPVPPDARPELRIEGETLSGNGGCNSLNGSLAVDPDGSLMFGDVEMTEIGCGGGILEFETAFVQALVASTNYSVDSNGLTLTGPNSVLVFVAAAPPVDLALEATRWRFDTIFSGSGASGTASTTNNSLPQVSLVIEGQQATLESADCGQIALPATFAGTNEGAFTILGGDNMVAPECSGGESNMTAAFEGLVTARGYTITQSRLTFIGAAGELVSFTAG